MEFPAIASAVLVCVTPVAAVLVCEALLVKNFSLKAAFAAVLLGFTCIAPVILAQILFGRAGLRGRADAPVLPRLAALFFESALFEEAVKAAALFFIPAKGRRPAEFFAYAVLCGLSFGCFETLIYLVSGTRALGLRLATAVVLHAALCALSSLSVFAAKARHPKVSYFVLAVVLHFVYNYFALFERTSPLFWVSIVVVGFALAECRICLRGFTLPRES